MFAFHVTYNSAQITIVLGPKEALATAERNAGQLPAAVETLESVSIFTLHFFKHRNYRCKN